MLVVTEELDGCDTLAASLAATGHCVLVAGTRSEALECLANSPVELVVLGPTLRDGSGLDLLREIGVASPATGVVVVSATHDSREMREALRRGALAYLRNPVDPLTVEAQVCVALARVRQGKTPAQRVRPTFAPEESATEAGLRQLLEQLPLNLATQLSHAWDLRHVETGAHVRRMAQSARRLALELGASENEAFRLGRVAMLHDIGKIAIPDAILTKPGKLTDEEFAIMKRHSAIGGELLSGFNNPFLDLAAVVARSHHERWNGSGYPDGLIGEACAWEARLVGVVDVYDALGQVRCYKPGWPTHRIVEFFEAERGKSFDAEMVDGLLAIVPELEAVKSQHPDPEPAQLASETRLKLEPPPVSLARAAAS